MIRRLVYVACDDCGNPIGDDSAMTDDAIGARIIAKRLGAVRIVRDGKRVDLCWRCKPDSQ